MRSLGLFTPLLLIFGCGTTPDPTIRYTWLGEHRSICFPDTLSTLPLHTDRDSMLGRIEFTYCEGRHTVTSWTDDHYAAQDGGTFWLELDNLGRIYEHSTTWSDCGIVRSTSDSINDLLLMAVGAAMRPAQFGLHYPAPPTPLIPTVRFSAADSLEQ